MNPLETSSRPTAVDTRFDAALRQHFCNEVEPDDDGFSQRVMAALPERVARRRIAGAEWAEWVERARWAAITLAACGVAALMPTRDAGVDAAQLTAAYALIGLLIFWSIPSRWSRG
jgi:hypothetical protein